MATLANTPLTDSIRDIKLEMTKTQKLPAIRGEIQLFRSANTDSNESGDQSFLTPRHLEKKLMEEIKIKDIRTADD